MTQLNLYKDEYSPRTSDSPYGISAGGIVYKKTDKGIEYLILGRTDKGLKSYHIPKGTLHIDETLEQCAVREIAEEAGVEIVLRTYLGGKQVNFEFKGVPNDKIIHYYAAEYIGESRDMDNEHDFRQWYSYEEAVKKLESHIKREDVFLERCHEYLQRHHG